MAALLLLGCNGSDDKPKPAAAVRGSSPGGPQGGPQKPGPSAPEGLWTGEVTLDGQARKAGGVVLGPAGNGEARFSLDDGEDSLLIAAFHGEGPGRAPDKAAAGAAGKGAEAARPGSASAGKLMTSIQEGGTRKAVVRNVHVTLDPITAQDRLSGTLQVDGKDHGRFQFQRARRDAYDQPVQLADLAGSYEAWDLTAVKPEGTRLVLQADGSFLLRDAGGLEVPGRLEVPDPARAGLKVRLESRGEGLFGKPLAGLGFVGSGAPRRLALLLDNGEERFLCDFFPAGLNKDAIRTFAESRQAGGKEAQPSPAPRAPEGFWAGEVTLKRRKVQADGVVLGPAGQGEARFVLDDGKESVIALALPAQGGQEAQGDGRFLTTAGRGKNRKNVAQGLHYTLDPMTSADELSGTLLVAGKDHGRFRFRRARRDAYERPLALAELAGTYQARTAGQPDGTRLMVQPDGSFLLRQPTGQEFPGRLEIPDPGRGGLKVTLDCHGEGTFRRPHQGVGMLGDPGGPQRRLGVLLDNGEDRFLCDFFPEGRASESQAKGAEPPAQAPVPEPPAPPVADDRPGHAQAGVPAAPAEAAQQGLRAARAAAGRSPEESKRNSRPLRPERDPRGGRD